MRGKEWNTNYAMQGSLNWHEYFRQKRVNQHFPIKHYYHEKRIPVFITVSRLRHRM